MWVWSRKAKTERFVSLVRQVFPGRKKLLEFLLFFAKSPNICLGQLQKSASYVVKNESCPLLAPFSRESPISKYSWTRTGRSGYAAGIGRTTSRRRTSAATSTTNRREPCLFSSTTTRTKTPLPTKITSYRKIIWLRSPRPNAKSIRATPITSSSAPKRTSQLVLLLGKINAEGDPKPVKVDSGTNAFEINYRLRVPVRNDIYTYLTS